MAEKGQSESKGLGLGVTFLLIVLGVFIVWVLTGGPSGKKSIIKNKTIETEKSTWPASDEIPSYGISNTSQIPTWPVN